MWQSLALFAHIVGALTLFISLALQWLITAQVRRADTLARVREWSGLASGLNRLAPISGVLILGAGFYMTLTRWSLLTTWVDVSLAAMLLLSALSMGVVIRRLKGIQRAASTADNLSAELRTRINDPVLWVAMQMAFTVALSIVYMMTIKPDLASSIVSAIVALVVGAALGMATLRRRDVPRIAREAVESR